MKYWVNYNVIQFKTYNHYKCTGEFLHAYACASVYDSQLAFLFQTVYLPAQCGCDTSKYGHTDNVQCDETNTHTCENCGQK